MRRYSFSKLSTFLRCPRRYLDRAEPEHLCLALPLGSAMPDAVQWEVSRRGMGEEPAADEIHHVFQELLDARLEIADCPVQGERDEAIATGRRMIGAYIAWGRIQDVSTIEGEHLGPVIGGTSVNSVIQKLKKRAHGYRSQQRFRNAIYFNLGRLDLFPEGATG
jgi:hypothetical protein